MLILFKVDFIMIDKNEEQKKNNDISNAVALVIAFIVVALLF